MIFQKSTKRSCDEATSCLKKCNFWWKNSNKICNYQSHPYLIWKSCNVVNPSIKYFCAILLLTHRFYFLSNNWKYNFLIDLYCETKSESSDSVAFVRVVWCSCRVWCRGDWPIDQCHKVINYLICLQQYMTQQFSHKVIKESIFSAFYYFSEIDFLSFLWGKRLLDGKPDAMSVYLKSMSLPPSHI